MSKIPTRMKDTRRNTTGARAAFRTPSTKTMADHVVERVSGIEIPDPPWQQMSYSERQCKQRGFVTLPEMAELTGYNVHTIRSWVQSFENFPDPKGKLSRPGVHGTPLVYHPIEILTWIEAALKYRFIHRPVKKKD